MPSLHEVAFCVAATVDDLFGDADDISSDEEAEKKEKDERGDDDEEGTQVHALTCFIWETNLAVLFENCKQVVAKIRSLICGT